ncbi:MAG: FAD-binding oxidoreductase [Jiangellaceae bacterium]
MSSATSTGRIDVSRLRSGLDGQVLLPGDDGYDAARSVWNAMVDRRPAVVVRCASTADVALAIGYARENGLEVGVRCGGHSILGSCVPAGGMMVDLSVGLAEVRVDPRARRAWVQGGAELGALDRAAQQFGLATTAGNVSHTGVGGLTLGGGMGWLARQYGLACDNVVSYQVVTADGATIRASETEHDDLYWGLRGGGGNFGVVTEFEFRLHPVGTRALLVDYTFDPADAPSATRRWRDRLGGVPTQAVPFAWVGTTADTPAVEPHLRGRPVASLGHVWVGDPDEGRQQLLPLVADLGNPVAEQVRELSYLALQTMEDDVQGYGQMRRYFKGHYLRELSDAAIDAFLGRDGNGDADPAVLPNGSLQGYGGAIADVPNDASAFDQRDTLVEFVASVRWADPAEDRARMDAARRSATALEPYASGAYVNVLSDEGEQGVRRAYGATKLARLAALKQRYDPDNVFHLNQNIAPTAEVGAPDG